MASTNTTHVLILIVLIRAGSFSSALPSLAEQALEQYSQYIVINGKNDFNFFMYQQLYQQLYQQITLSHYFLPMI